MEIKFRIWDAEFQQMCQVTSIQLSGTKQKVEGCGLNVPPYGFRDISTAKFPLLQYTGLDLHGEELYNGDILEVTYESKTSRVPIFFEEGCFCVKWNFEETETDVATLGYALSDWECMEAEVKLVGNVHEEKTV